MKKKAGILLFWLALWQLLALWIHNPILLASPAETIESLIGMAGTGDFWYSVVGTLLGAGGGILLGSLLGILLAAAAVRWPVLQDLLSPLLTMMKAVPVASFIILLLIWQGSRWIALWISLIVVLPVLYFNTREGLLHTDPALLEMARVYRMSFGARCRGIYRAQLRPYLVGAFSIAVGMGFKSGVAAEVIGQPLRTLGNGLYRAKIYLDTGRLFAWTAVIVLLAWGTEKLVQRLLCALLGPKREKKREEEGRP